MVFIVTESHAAIHLCSVGAYTIEIMNIRICFCEYIRSVYVCVREREGGREIEVVSMCL